jgi:hypothetical protein
MKGANALGAKMGGGCGAKIFMADNKLTEEAA